jgi:hypothetical protein
MAINPARCPADGAVVEFCAVNLTSHRWGVVERESGDGTFAFGLRNVYIFGVSPVRLSFIRPLSPTASVRPPQGDDWLHEPTWDGFRFQVQLSPSRREDHPVNAHSTS